MKHDSAQCELHFTIYIFCLMERSAGHFVVEKFSFPELRGFLNWSVGNYRMTLFLLDLGNQSF